MTRRTRKPLHSARPTRCRVCRRDLWKDRCENVYCARYKQGDRLRYKAGTRVVVRGYEREGARTVEQVYSDIDGGRRLDAPVDGFVSWNVDSLRRAPKARRR